MEDLHSRQPKTILNFTLNQLRKIQSCNDKIGESVVEILIWNKKVFTELVWFVLLINYF